MSEDRASDLNGALLRQLIVDQAWEGVIFADTAGIIRVWNRSAETLFGFSAAEALGASLDLIIPERFRRAHWAGFDKALERGRTQHGGLVRTTRALHKDGRKLYVELSFGIITADNGEVLGSLGVARAGNDRYQAELDSRQRIAALQAEVAALRAASRPASGEVDAGA